MEIVFVIVITISNYLEIIVFAKKDIIQIVLENVQKCHYALINTVVAQHVKVILAFNVIPQIHSYWSLLIVNVSWVIILMERIACLALTNLLHVNHAYLKMYVYHAYKISLLIKAIANVPLNTIRLILILAYNVQQDVQNVNLMPYVQPVILFHISNLLEVSANARVECMSKTHQKNFVYHVVKFLVVRNVICMDVQNATQYLDSNYRISDVCVIMANISILR